MNPIKRDIQFIYRNIKLLFGSPKWQMNAQVRAIRFIREFDKNGKVIDVLRVIKRNDHDFDTDLYSMVVALKNSVQLGDHRVEKIEKSRRFGN